MDYMLYINATENYTRYFDINSHLSQQLHSELLLLIYNDDVKCCNSDGTVVRDGDDDGRSPSTIRTVGLCCSICNENAFV